LCGVWHDHVALFDLAGRPLPVDDWSGTPGPAPFETLVYVSFERDVYRQTNVVLAGRPLAVRSFRGVVSSGVLIFDSLGPDDPEHVGVSGGPGVLVFCARRVTDAWRRYHEPDVIRLLGNGRRTRSTLLYRDGVAVRTLAANGRRVSADSSRRVAWDPRGADGPVHEQPRETLVFQERPA
jgi:hypothetical protein